MEGLIPLVYKAIVQYRNGGQNGMNIETWALDDTQYMRLPTGDSGRLPPSAAIQIFRQDYGFAAACSPERPVSAAAQHHLTNSFRAVK